MTIFDKPKRPLRRATMQSPEADVRSSRARLKGKPGSDAHENQRAVPATGRHSPAEADLTDQRSPQPHARMGPAHQRAAGTADTGVRASIVRAATSVFAREGYAAASLRRIAAEAGTTKPMIYYYFGNKESLHRAVLDLELSSIRQTLAAKLSPEASVRDKLLILAQIYTDSSLAAADSVQFLLSHGTSNRQAPALALQGVHVKVVRAIIVDGIRRGEVRNDIDATLLAEAFHGALSALLLPSPEHPSATGTSHATRLIDLFLEGAKSR